VDLLQHLAEELVELVLPALHLLVNLVQVEVQVILEVLQAVHMVAEVVGVGVLLVELVMPLLVWVEQQSFSMDIQ
jgi:hypothetical protein